MLEYESLRGDMRHWKERELDWGRLVWKEGLVENMIVWKKRKWMRSRKAIRVWEFESTFSYRIVWKT